MVFLSQRVYCASATMLFFVINVAVSWHLNGIRQQLRVPNLLASQIGTLRESYYLCHEVVDEINDTFGLTLLTTTLHDFVEIVTQGMYAAANWSNCNEWYIYVLNTLIIFCCLANLILINFSAQHLTQQVIPKHTYSSHVFICMLYSNV